MSATRGKWLRRCRRCGRKFKPPQSLVEELRLGRRMGDALCGGEHCAADSTATIAEPTLSRADRSW